MRINLKTLMLSTMLVGGATAAYGYDKNNGKISETIDTLKSKDSDINARTADFGQFRNLYQSDVMIKKSNKLTRANTASKGISNKEQYDIYNAARSNLVNNLYPLYNNNSMYDYRQNQNYKNEYNKHTFKSVQEKHDNIVNLHFLVMNGLAQTKGNFASFLQDNIEQVEVFKEDRNVNNIYDGMSTVISSTQKLYDEYEQDINSIYNEKSLATYKFSAYSQQYEHERLSQFLANEVTKLSYLIDLGQGTIDMKEALQSLKIYRDSVLAEEQNYDDYILNTSNSPVVYKMASEQMEKFMNIIANLKTIPAFEDNQQYMRSLNVINSILSEIKSSADSFVVSSNKQDAREQMFMKALYRNVIQFGNYMQNMIAILEAKLADLQKAIDAEGTTEPDDPNQPDSPVQPDNPNQPDNPVQPDNPNQPDDPAQPDDPTVPDEPAEPEGTVDVKATTTSQPNKNVKHFDMNGREISPTRPGIHILSNGKKVIVK